MNRVSATLGFALVFGASLAHAEQAGAEQDWEVKIGAHVVDPKSDNGTLAAGALRTKVGDSWRPTVTLEYRATRNLGIEILAAAPFEHDVKLNGAVAAKVKQLPPTLSLQWHFLPDQRFDPFVGVGLNFARFFSIDEKGPLAGTQLELGDSWGVAAHAGVEYAIADRWSLTVDARWIKLSTDAKVNGAKVGSVDIDPLVYGFAIGYRF
ncbi:MAG: OmpW family outer membrane protein [Dokdonella sp.]